MSDCKGCHWVNVTFIENGKRYASTGCVVCKQREPGAPQQEIPFHDLTGLAAAGPKVWFTYAARPIVLSTKGFVE